MIIAAVGICDWRILAAEDVPGGPRRHQRLEEKDIRCSQNDSEGGSSTYARTSSVEHRRRHWGGQNSLPGGVSWYQAVRHVGISVLASHVCPGRQEVFAMDFSCNVKIINIAFALCLGLTFFQTVICSGHASIKK